MTSDVVEGYLDQLLTHLRGSATDVRRILSETEEHLRDATAEPWPRIGAGPGGARGKGRLKWWNPTSWADSCRCGQVDSCPNT